MDVFGFIVKEEKNSMRNWGVDVKTRKSFASINRQNHKQIKKIFRIKEKKCENLTKAENLFKI